MMKFFVVNLLFICTLDLNGCPTVSKDSIEQPAVFLYDTGSLNCYVNNTIKMPSEANGIIRYEVSLTVNIDSTTSNILIKDIFNILCEDCEKQLMQVLSQMPKWKPAIKNGKYITSRICQIVKIDLINYPLGCKNG